MIRDVFSSKTLGLWIIIFFVALLAIMIATAVQLIFNAEIPFMGQFFNLLEWGGTGGTVRNVISDGVAPRIPQAIGSFSQPGVSLEAPMSMKHSEGPHALDGLPEGFEVR